MPKRRKSRFAGVVQWQNGSFPSCIRGFDSLRPLQSPLWDDKGFPQRPVTHCLMSVTRQGRSRVNWKIEHSPFTDDFGFRSFRILQEMEQLTMLQEKKPALLRAFFCITSLGIRLRRSQRLHSGRHNHSRHSKAAERSRSFHNTAERNRSFYNMVGSDDSRNGGSGASVDGAN